MLGRWLRVAVSLLGAGAVGRADAQNAAVVSVALTPGTLAGTVFDSSSGRPLAGAFVQLAPATAQSRGQAVSADSIGAFAFAAVTPGRYLVTFAHPTTDVLGVEMPVHTVDVPAGGLVGLTLATPGPARLFAALCGRRAAGDSSGALVGAVRDAATGLPVPDATLVLTWEELALERGDVRVERQRAPKRVGVDGAFQICGVPSDADVVASAESPGRRGGTIALRIPRGGVLNRSLTLADTAEARAVAARDSTVGAPVRTVLRGTAAVRGTVRQADGSPVRGATVVALGSDVAARTRERGEFTLEGLPAGTHDLEVRALGFAPVRVAVDLRSGATTSADAMLGARVTQLESVIVKGTRDERRRTGLERIAARRRSAVHGTFITAADLAKRGSIYMSDALRAVPGIRTTPVPGRALGYAITGRGGCRPALYIDGMPIQGGANAVDSVIRPSEVLAVEVYTSGAATPAEFGTGCAIAIWTK